MKTSIISSAILSICTLVACNSTPSSQQKDRDTVANVTENHVDTIHTSQNSVDWNGTYEGVIPCADCPGIKTTIVLNNDDTFNHTSTYLKRNTTVADSGKIMWHDNGSVVHLKGKEIDSKLKVGENKLFLLDQDGKRIEGPIASAYELIKVR